MNEISTIINLIKRLFTNSSAAIGGYDQKDLLVGHGLDSLCSVKVWMVLAVTVLLALWCNFFFAPDLIGALSFGGVFTVLVWYIHNYPECIVSKTFFPTKQRLSSLYRSFLSGRIIFTPTGLSLSLFRRKLVFKRSSSDKSKDEEPPEPVVVANAQPSAFRKLLAPCLKLLFKINPPPTEIVVFSDYSLNDLKRPDAGFWSYPVDQALSNILLYPGFYFTLDQLAILRRSEAQILSKTVSHQVTEKNLVFLGIGYQLQPRHRRVMQDLMEVGLTPSAFGSKGSPDIHQIEKSSAFNPLFFNRNLLQGHTLLLGTTGSGKTRILDLLISQAIIRKDSVIIIDPKGDLGLQQCIIRAMRFAHRDPIVELVCLDIGRPSGLDLTSNQAEQYASLSAGTKLNWLYANQGDSSLIEIGSDNLQHPQEVVSGSPLDKESFNASPDEHFFAMMNTGFNPTSSFDRSTEIGLRISAMMAAGGSSESFRAYAQMAVTAAVELLILSGKNISLENIRSIVVDHSAFINGLRFFLNQIVEQLDRSDVTKFFNCLHGVSNAQLQTYSRTISTLLGEYADRSVSKKEEDLLLVRLVEEHVITPTKATEAKIEAINSGFDDEEEEVTNSKSKRGSSTRSKKGVHPASLTDLNKFYRWLVDKNFIRKNASFDKMLEIASLAPDFYRKVTNGVMPYLSALTAGDLSELLSSSERKLPTFLDIVKQQKVVYVALHCLKDASTGQALGKLMMSDLAYVAGELNVTESSHQPVSIFIDEASELSNEGLVQLLNKSRSVNFSITLATQCFADLSKRTGSRTAAEQIIANCNNLISLRVNDLDTANIVASVLPQTVIGLRSSSIMNSDNGCLTNSSVTSRSVTLKESPLFPESMLMQLPDLEFIARMASGAVYKCFIPILEHNTKNSCKCNQNPTPVLPTIDAEKPINAYINSDAQLSGHTLNDYDPEFEQVAQMVDLGFHVSPDQKHMPNQVSSRDLNGSCWDKQCSDELVQFKIAGSSFESSSDFLSRMGLIQGSTPKTNASTGVYTASDNLRQGVRNVDDPLHDDVTHHVNANLVSANQIIGQPPAAEHPVTIKEDLKPLPSNLAAKGDVKESGDSWSMWLIKSIVSILFSKTVVNKCSLLFEICVMLFIAFCISCLVFGIEQWHELTESLQQSASILVFYGFQVLPSVIIDHHFALNNYSMLSCIKDALSLYFNNLELVLAIFISGGLIGHNFSIDSEIRHSSLTGWRQCTNLLGWPWLILWGISIALLAKGFVLSVEVAQIVIALAALSLGFYIACFFSQHTR